MKKFLNRLTRTKQLASNKGMTLIEIMVVVAIIGLVMAMVTVNVMKRFEKAKLDTAKTQIKSLEQALEQYYLDNNNYPPTFSELVSGGYVKKMPKDPWNQEYVYKNPGSEGHPFDITSAGPDKKEGSDDDIKSE